MTPFIGQGEQEETQVWIMGGGGGGDHIYIYIHTQRFYMRVAWGGIRDGMSLGRRGLQGLGKGASRLRVWGLGGIRNV